jgi:hypothetical protein
MGIRRACFWFFLALTVALGGYNLGRAALGPKRGLDFQQYYMVARMLEDGCTHEVYHSYLTHTEDEARRPDHFYQRLAPRYGVRPVTIGRKQFSIMDFRYPPFVAFFWSPLARLTFDQARNLMLVLNVVATLAAPVLLLANRRGTDRHDMLWAGVLATFLFFPNYYAFYMGQFNSLLFLFCAAALYFLRRRGDVTAGFFLALSAVLKVYPLVFVPFLLLKRRFRALAAMGVWIVVLTAVSFTVCDLQMYEDWACKVVPKQMPTHTTFRNQSIAGTLARCLTPNRFAEPVCEAPAAAAWGARVLVLATLALALAATGTRDDAGSPRFDVEYGLYFMLPMLVVAKAWEHYGMLLLPAYLAAFEHFAFERSKRPWLLGVVCLSYAVWGFVLNLGLEYHQLPKHWVMQPVFASKFLATCGLFAVLLVLLMPARDSLLSRIRGRFRGLEA